MKTFLRPPDAALYLCTTVGTLKSWRYQGRGPRWHKRGRSVLYALDDLEGHVQGEWTAMTATPPPQTMGSLSDHLPAPAWEAIHLPAPVLDAVRYVALDTHKLPAAVIAGEMVELLARRILRWQ